VQTGTEQMGSSNMYSKFNIIISLIAIVSSIILFIFIFEYKKNMPLKIVFQGEMIFEKKNFEDNKKEKVIIQGELKDRFLKCLNSPPSSTNHDYDRVQFDEVLVVGGKTIYISPYPSEKPQLRFNDEWGVRLWDIEIKLIDELKKNVIESLNKH
jgi:hypothetical protein